MWKPGLMERSQWITRLAKARAYMRESGFVTVDDIRFVLPHVLRHRLTLTERATRKQQWDTDKVVAEAVRCVEYK